MRRFAIKHAKTPVESAMAHLQSIVPFDRIQDRYEEPWRHHHAWHHPTSMFEDLIQAERDGVHIHAPLAFCMFIPWHDIVYYSHAPHGMNERLSASLCGHHLSGLVDRDEIETGMAAILTTIDHRTNVDAGPDNGLQLDLDLGILGKGPDEYDRYDDGIRKEYGHVDHDTYWTKRREILTGFLSRDRLYITDWAHDRWDASARENLTRSISKATEALRE